VLGGRLRLTWQALLNFRDLGGYRTSSGGIVARNRIFRSSQLSGLPAGTVQALEGLRIRRVYDFRTAQERVRFPDVYLDGASQVWLNVLSDDSDSLAATLQLLLQDPPKANLQLTPERIQGLYQGIYENLVVLPSAIAAYGTFFSSLLECSEAPAVFHCTAGKDRTGWAAALLLALLGVSPEDILADYLASNEQLRLGFTTVIEAFVDAGGKRSVVENLLLVRREYLDAAFTTLTQRYGTVSEYFSQALGFSRPDQAALILAYTGK
jgi:protein-tyrosine phosphatase